jgi:hypothetical protein
MRKALSGSRGEAEAPPTVTSGKLAALMQMLRELASEGQRVLVFSQFTAMLDLIKPELATAEIDHVELTGATRDRADPISRFQSGAVPVFLISLKAGGRGLNLTAADSVIHYDPWWNPAVEHQATDRAHRIGQTKSVFGAGKSCGRILELDARPGRIGVGMDDPHKIGPIRPIQLAGDLDRYPLARTRREPVEITDQRDHGPNLGPLYLRIRNLGDHLCGKGSARLCRVSLTKPTYRRIVLRCCSVPQAKPSPDYEYRISLRPHPVGHPSSSTRDSASRAVPSSIRVRRDGYREAREWQQAGGDQRDRAAQKVFARAGSRKPRSDQHQECSTTDNHGYRRLACRRPIK